ncbi:MAG: NDP-sugar synthase [Candidatus Rokubacteria bacterium]|nr:NDP-sugar synthase [Candidatus Rokubacteria bacterium]
MDAAGALTGVGTQTQAIILAGGQGTRLRPLTYTRPKPVVPLLNHPFLAYQLRLLRDHGVTDVILACSYKVDDVRAILGDGAALGTRLRYVIETEPLGTGGGVRNAADLARGTLFVLNGDVLTDADLGAMRAFHVARGARATLYVTRVEDPRAYGLIETEDDGRILAFREKPGPTEPITTNVINAGIYLLDAALLPRIPADRPVSIEREFFPALIADGLPVYAWEGPSYWRDIGSPAAYLDAQMDLLDERVRTSVVPAGARSRGSWIAPGASIDATAVIEGPSVIGAGVSVAAGSRIGPRAVLGDGVRVETGARVERSVVWDGTEIGKDARLESCVIGSGSRVGAGAHVGRGAVLESGAVVPAQARLPEPG